MYSAADLVSRITENIGALLESIGPRTKMEQIEQTCRDKFPLSNSL